MGHDPHDFNRIISNFPPARLTFKRKRYIIKMANSTTIRRLPIPKDRNHIYSIDLDFPTLSDFEEKEVYPALIVPAKITNEIKSLLGPLLLKKKRTRNVFPVTESEAASTKDYRQERKIVLVKSISKSDANNATNTCISDSLLLFDDVWNNAFTKLHEMNIDSFRKSTMEIVCKYQDLTVEQVLKQMLPLEYVSSGNIPCSFETVGHLAHMNLPDHLLPFKYIIAKVIGDKNYPTIQIVANKISTIQNEFRTFPMETLYNNIPNSSKDDSSLFEVQVKQGGCIFHLNFAKVYWNSRLQFEHDRLVKLIAASTKQQEQQQQHIVVADVMAGVGPFAIPLSSSTYAHVIQQVYANDLNPISYKYLKANAAANNCSNIKCFNLDGRAFIHSLLMMENTNPIHHVIMNLPALAIEFLNAFRGWALESQPIIHVYCFETKNDINAKRNAIERCEIALGCKLEDSTTAHPVQIHIVRDVSPNKNMLCVSFRLPVAAATLDRIIVPSSSLSDEKDDPARIINCTIPNDDKLNDGMKKDVKQQCCMPGNINASPPSSNKRAKII
mmetsp:Transcript_705/g.1037  ORF Transcript_705/g.1037 Transcript_705/m.1037 type:complete len:556 (-) Transcript_705:27-1694(-)